MLDTVLRRYDYTACLTRRGWAWEHLRRNHGFCRAAWSGDPGPVSRLNACHARIDLMKLRRAQPDAEAWGLIFFPNPDHTALKADLFWSDEIHPNPIRVTVHERLPGEADEIFERTLKVARVTHFTDWTGNEHLLLRGARCSVQVRCVGRSFLSGAPVKMAYDIHGPSDVTRKYKAFRDAETILEEDPCGPLSWSPQAERWRNGLICLDMKEAGLSLRQAAIVIYGKARVEADWMGASSALRDRMRAYHRSAKALRDGGYRRLLGPRERGSAGQVKRMAA